MPIHPLLPTPFDNVTTVTSEDQITTESNIITYLKPYHTPAKPDPVVQEIRPIESVILRRSDHISFLSSNIFELSERWTMWDASRSWILYWALGSLSMLDIQITPEERDRSIRTILSFQHPDGGFGGGPGHLAHLAATYASVCCLAILLEEADDDVVKETWSKVDIKKLYDWMVRLKVPGGGFAVQREGEVDVRGIYGALAVATMLNLLTPELARDLPEYIVSCQTYEGGMTASSIHKPKPSFPEKQTRAPIGEAHGGYTSCALASYFILQAIPNLTTGTCKLDHEACLRWAAQAQALPIDGGGFKGRTNKLVDGCYAWWCGGLFPILEAMIISNCERSKYQLHSSAAIRSSKSPLAHPSAEHANLSSLYDRQALQEYILLASQDQPPTESNGGLRDKPGMSPDLYHTHYILAGLSLAQHSPRYSLENVKQRRETFQSPERSNIEFKDSNESQDELLERMRGIYARTLGWNFDQNRVFIVGMPENKVGKVNPVLNIRQSAAEKIMKHFYHQSQ